MIKVVSGEDPRGVTTSADWKGGGGFRFYVLAPSLLETDKWGNWVVSQKYKPEMLAEAMCKLEGFSYAPDPEVFWIHGRSTESDFIYITTQNLSHDQLQFISDQVGDERTLLICCSAFRAKPDAFANLTLKKIPQAVLHRCEWGRDDYSLNVNALPGSEPEADQEEEGSSEATPVVVTTTNAMTPPPARRRGRPRRQSSPMQELPLFANLDQGGDA
jgi:adenine-specific DNA-methyltransferase